MSLPESPDTINSDSSVNEVVVEALLMGIGSFSFAVDLEESSFDRTSLFKLGLPEFEALYIELAKYRAYYLEKHTFIINGRGPLPKLEDEDCVHFKAMLKGYPRYVPFYRPYSRLDMQVMEQTRQKIRAHDIVLQAMRDLSPLN